ncbi:MAG: hypothetical protein HC813_00495, partial [Planctomycetes bacterium]|nr:hypothetical protein [Planctomycetota bacterium]
MTAASARSMSSSTACAPIRHSSRPSSARSWIPPTRGTTWTIPSRSGTRSPSRSSPPSCGASSSIPTIPTAPRSTMRWRPPPLPSGLRAPWGDSHTLTGEEIGDFFSEAEWPACPEATAAVSRHLESHILRWRRRVSDKASSTFFGIVLRHVGVRADRLFAEWEAMNEDERVDLLKRAGEMERPG